MSREINILNRLFEATRTKRLRYTVEFHALTTFLQNGRVRIGHAISVLLSDTEQNMFSQGVK